MDEIDNIEIRSEKTRKIIDMNPSVIIRYGTLIITIIMTALFCGSYLFPFPENLQTDATVIIDSDGEMKVCTYIPYSYLNTIHEFMTAQIEFEGYPSSDYGYASAIIYHIEQDVYNINGQNYFVAYMNISESDGIIITPKMNGRGNLLISNKTILQQILKL